MYFLLSSPYEVSINGRHAEVDNISIQLAQDCPPLIACRTYPIHYAIQADIQLVVPLLGFGVVDELGDLADDVLMLITCLAFLLINGWVTLVC